MLKRIKRFVKEEWILIAFEIIVAILTRMYIIRVIINQIG